MDPKLIYIFFPSILFSDFQQYTFPSPNHSYHLIKRDSVLERTKTHLIGQEWLVEHGWEGLWRHD